MQLFFVFIFMNLSLIKSLILFLFGVFVIFQYYFEFNHVEKISITTGIYLIVVLILYWIYKIFKTQQVHKYQDKYKDVKAYEKQSLMVKTIVNLSDNQEIEISATKNESDNILYPSTGMDAKYDDSELINLKYTANNLSKLSKKLDRAG